MASSQDSSSDSSASSPQHPYDGPDVEEAENLLPGVLMAMQHTYSRFFCQVSAMGSGLEFPPLRDGARALLQLMPCDSTTIERLHALFTNIIEHDTADSMFFSAAPAEVIEKLYSRYMHVLTINAHAL